ncbi:MAG: flagellar motor protein [Dehalococcoidia bacterium]
MGITTIVGFLIAVGGILGGLYFKGISPMALFNMPGIFVVIIGTLGATVLSFPKSTVASIPSSYLLALKGSSSPPSHELVNDLVSMADKARREGLLALEEEAQNTTDEFARKGLMLMIDGTDPDSLRSIMEIEIEGASRRGAERAEIFKVGAAYAPTLGVVGAVLGLIGVLSKLGGDPAELGQGIAVAFVATFYGVGMANLLLLPLALKLKSIAAEEQHQQELVLEGVLAIQAGDNPRIVREKLQAFLPPSERVTEQDEAAGGTDRVAA